MHVLVEAWNYQEYINALLFCGSVVMNSVLYVYNYVLKRVLQMYVEVGYKLAKTNRNWGGGIFYKSLFQVRMDL